MDNKLIFATSTNLTLADFLVEHKIGRLGQAKLGRHRDGEIYYELFESVADHDTIVIGSSFPPAENLLELFTVINTLKLNKAKKITLLVPYFGYAKADRLDRPNLPVNSKLFIEFIEHAGADAVMILDLHSERNMGYFNVPFTNLTAMPLMARYFDSLNIKDLAVTSPDLGDVARATLFAKTLGQKSIIAIEKYRPTVDTAVDVSINGDPKGKNVVIADDMVQTGGTLIAAAKTLKEMGAQDVYAAVTHFVYSGPALENLKNANVFKGIVTTDSIPTPKDLILPDNFTVISMAQIFLDSLNSSAV